MFGQTLDGGAVAALCVGFLMLVAIVALSWRPRRMSFLRGMIGGVSASLAWLMIGVVSFFSGDGTGVAIGVLFGMAGMFCTFMAHREYRKPPLQQARMVVSTYDVNIPRQR